MISKTRLLWSVAYAGAKLMDERFMCWHRISLARVRNSLVVMVGLNSS